MDFNIFLVKPLGVILAALILYVFVFGGHHQTKEQKLQEIRESLHGILK